MHVFRTMDANNTYMYSTFWVKAFFPLSFIKNQINYWIWNHRWQFPAISSAVSVQYKEWWIQFSFSLLSLTSLLKYQCIHTTFVCQVFLLWYARLFYCLRNHISLIVKKTRHDVMFSKYARWNGRRWSDPLSTCTCRPLIRVRVRSVSILWVCFEGVVSWHAWHQVA